MPIRKPLTQRFTSFARGVDNTTDFVSEAINGTLSVANNADLVNESLVSKRKGYKNFATSANRIFRQGLEYNQPSGKRSVILYHESESFSLNSGTISEMDNAGTITDLLTAQKSNVQPSIVQFATRLFIYNGDTNYVYDGSNVTEVGMVAPDEAPVDAGAGTGGDLNPGGTYLYVYTYYNSATGDESSPSPASESITAPANGSIRLLIKDGNPLKADQIRLYRTVDGGADLFFDRSIPIDRTSVDSEVADVNLGKLLEPDGSVPPGAFKYAISTDNRIFLAGLDNNPGRVYWTKIGSEGPQAEVVQALDFTDCNLNDGDTILGLGIVNNVVIVKKQNSIGRLVKIETSLIGEELAGSQKYIYEEISRDITGISHHCGVTLGNLYVWLGRDEIYATDGVRILRLGDRIRNTLSSLNYIFANKFTAVVKKDTKQIIWSVCTGANAEPDFQIVGHYRYLPQMAFTFYTPGANATTHPGLKATSFFTRTEGNLLKYYFGTSDGKIHQMATGDNDDNLGIAFDVRLPWAFGRDPINQKVFHSAYFHIFGNGNDYDVDLSFECDLQEANIIESITMSINEDPEFLWEDVNWEEFNWSFLSFDPVKLFPKQRANYGRYGVQNDNANEPLAINAITSILQTFPIHR